MESNIRLVVLHTMGGATMVSVSQSIFTNRLLRAVRQTAPHIKDTTVLATGAADLGHAFSGADLACVVAAYMKGLKWTFAIVVALSTLTFFISLLSKPRSKKPKLVSPA